MYNISLTGAISLHADQVLPSQLLSLNLRCSVCVCVCFTIRREFSLRSCSCRLVQYRAVQIKKRDKNLRYEARHFPSFANLPIVLGIIVISSSRERLITHQADHNKEGRRKQVMTFQVTLTRQTTRSFTQLWYST